MRRVAALRLIILLTLALLLPFSAYGETAESAFKELQELKIPYTGDAFLEYARKGDRAVVELFLTAGMYPNVRAEHGFTALMGAVAEGHVDIVNLLLDKGADPNAKDDQYGMTALMDAVINGRADVVRILLDRGADADAADKDGRTPLMLATGDRPPVTRYMPSCESPDKNVVVSWSIGPIGRGNADIVEALLAKGASVDKADKDGRTALMIAARRSQIEIVRALLRAGADPNAKTKTFEFGSSKQRVSSGGHSLDIGNGWVPLMYAMFVSDLEVVQALLGAGADPNVPDKHGVTPLMFASFYQGHAAGVVKALLDAGADPNAKDKHGETALTYASDEGHTDTVQLLRKAGAQNLPQYGMTDLMRTAVEGDTEKLAEALAKGGDINQRDAYGQTALYLAASEGRVKVVEALLKNGANVNSTCDIGQRPLYMAAFEGHLEVVDVLLKHGADANVKTNYGNTALIAAVAKGYIGIVQALLRAGADVNAEGTDGSTALVIAAQCGNTEMTKLLLENSADVNAKSGSSTALIWASELGHIEIVRMLLDKGADVTVKDTRGMTALAAAKYQGHTDVIELLEKAQAPHQLTP